MGVPDKISITDIAVTDIIPQRPPMVMVDALISAEDSVATTRFSVREDNIFYSDGSLTCAGMVENIAQTAAAGFGFPFFKAGKPIPLGFIGQVKNLKVFFLPRLNDTLITETRIEGKILNSSLLSGKITVNGRVSLTCEMKLFTGGAGGAGK